MKPSAHIYKNSPVIGCQMKWPSFHKADCLGAFENAHKHLKNRRMILLSRFSQKKANHFQCVTFYVLKPQTHNYQLNIFFFNFVLRLENGFICDENHKDFVFKEKKENKK